MVEAGAAASEQLAPRPRFWRRWSLAGSLARGCVLAFLVGVISEVVNHLLCGNRHTVVPGLIYRCGQPSTSDMEHLVRKYGVRTVVNLRGHCPGNDWYVEEVRAANRLNVALEDVNFSAGQFPAPQQVHRLVEVIDRSQYPIAFHCFRGVDRTGMASAMALILKTGASLDEARKALSIRYLHLPWGRTGNLDRFIDLYEEWLLLTGRSHSSDVFRHWLLREYNGGACSARIEVLGTVGHELVSPTPAADDVWLRLAVPRGGPFGVKVRVHNTSSKPWWFHPGDTAGFHLVWSIHTSKGALMDDGRAGRFHAVVQPGKSIDLILALPTLREPGDYHLTVDMKEEQHCLFHQAGSKPLRLVLEVP